MQKIIKLIAWSVVVSFIVYILKKKCCFCINEVKNEQPVIEYKNETIEVKENEPIEVMENYVI